MVRNVVVAGLVLLGLAAVPSLILGQSQARVFLGVGVESTQEGAKHAGVIVRTVAPDSPAAKAGLKEGDIIDKVDGKDVKDFESLLSVLRQHRPGDQVSFHVMRADQERNLQVTLGQRPRPGENSRERASAFLGVQTQPLTRQVKEELGVKVDNGAAIVDVLADTPAAKAGLKRGDVIISLGDKTVSNPKELRDAVHAAGVGKEVKLTVMRGEEKKDFQVRLEESPVDGLSFLPVPFPGRLNFGTDASQLERRLQELEKRVRELEQKGNPSSK